MTRPPPSSRSRRAPRAVAALALAALAAGCTERKEAAPPGAGVLVAAGHARELQGSPDGAWLAFLDGCREARGPSLPARTASCDLRVVPAAGGEALHVAGAVTTLPGAFRLADRLAALAGYDYPSATGTLVEWRPGAGTRKLAEGVGFFGFDRAGTLGYVAGEGLFLAPPEGSPVRVAGSDGAATFEFRPPTAAPERSAAAVALARRRARDGGDLLLVRSDLQAAPIAGPVGDYGFAPVGSGFAFTRLSRDGAELLYAETTARAAAPRRLAAGVRSFAFAPGVPALAFISEAGPGKHGDLHVVGPGGQDRVLARGVGELRWAARAPRLVWLEAYDPRVRSGTVGAGGLDVAPRTFAANVTDVAISADGAHVAFLRHTTRGGYSVDLELAHLEAGSAPEVVAHGVFGFSFSPDAAWLYYRTRCTRNAEACDVERIPAAGLPAGGQPELIAQGAKSFEFDPLDPGRLLVTFARTDREALDVAVWQAGRLVALDTYVLPGSARFLGPDSRRVAYVVTHERRPGVYVATVPAPGGAGR